MFSLGNGYFPVKSPYYFIAEAPSNPLLILPLIIKYILVLYNVILYIVDNNCVELKMNTFVLLIPFSFLFFLLQAQSKDAEMAKEFVAKTKDFEDYKVNFEV